jgi:hypothetical protein
LFDALACWPPTEATGAQPARIDAWGGFLNGAWSPRLRRVGVGRADPGAAVEPRVRPYLEPLASPPPSWRFVARDGAAPALPGGLKPRTGYLLRHDGEAVMFPVRVESSLDKDGFYVARVRFAYADEGVSFQVNGRASPPASWGSLGAWSFELHDLIDAETRGGPAGDDLLCSRRVYDWRGPYVQPLPRLAQRLTAALIDGWLAWDGSGRLLDDPEQLASLASQGAPPPLPALAASGVDLGAKGLVAVDGGYHGGRFARRSMTGYLHQDGWTEAGAPLALGNG